jgi:hypothetical protein
MKKRGVIIYPKIDNAQNFYDPKYEEFGKSVHIEYTEIDPIMIRMYALYWDLIDWPESNLINLGPYDTLLAETNLLIQEGVMTRSKILFREIDYRTQFFSNILKETGTGRISFNK